MGPSCKCNTLSGISISHSGSGSGGAGGGVYVFCVEISDLIVVRSLRADCASKCGWDMDRDPKGQTSTVVRQRETLQKDLLMVGWDTNGRPLIPDSAFTGEPDQRTPDKALPEDS